ncbi:MAG: glycosyltransferase, partial [Turicibacter sp.]
MIRILDVASTDQGAYRLLRTRVKKIDKDSSFENFIICPSGPWQKKMLEQQVKWIEFEVSRGLGIFNIFNEIKQMERILLQYKPDIVHSHNSKTGAIARLSVWLVNRKYHLQIKMIHQVHGYHFTSFKGFKKLLYLLIEIVLAMMSDSLLFQNKYELALSEKYKMDKFTDLVYIGNGVDLDEFEKIKPQSGKQGTKKIVCIARIEPVKNHLMLLEVINQLKNSNNQENFKLIIIGEGDI